jgi:hypothetical protein
VLATRLFLRIEQGIERLAAKERRREHLKINRELFKRLKI